MVKKDDRDEPPKLLNQKSARKYAESKGFIETKGGNHVVKMEKEGCRPITLPKHRGQDYSTDLSKRIRNQIDSAWDMAKITFTVCITEEDDGSFWAEVEELPGCFASGFSMDELMEATKKAIQLYLPEGIKLGKATWGDVEVVEPTSSRATRKPKMRPRRRMLVHA